MEEMNLWIGTSGFQYPEWKGGFYPEQMSPARMLPYYAERFATTEINYSFRRITSARTISTWDAATPGRFRFSFKAPQRVTHFAKLQNCTEILSYFQQAIAPLAEKLGPVLFQLPPTFKQDVPLLRSFLADQLPAGMRAAFEFRHPSWFDDEVYEALREQGAALCIAENEDLKTPAQVTSPFGYLRLRREDYTPAMLTKWAKFVQAQTQWSDVFVYFKHEERGVGPEFAHSFAGMFPPRSRSGPKAGRRANRQTQAAEPNPARARPKA